MKNSDDESSDNNSSNSYSSENNNQDTQDTQLLERALQESKREYEEKIKRDIKKGTFLKLNFFKNEK